MSNIILTNPESRKTFDIFNVLKKTYENSTFIVIGKNSWIWKLIYRNSIFIDLKNQTLSKVLVNIDKEYPNSIFLPLEEESILSLYSVTEQINSIKYFLPKENIFKILRNKIKLSKWCERNGFPVPKRFEGDTYLTEDVIRKPSIGTGSKGIHRINKGEYLKSDEDFITQRIIESNRGVIGFFAFAINGKVSDFYCHERLRTWPSTGGVSIHSISIKHKEITELSKKIIRKLNYSGVIMIEFMIDSHDQKPKLIEINPRFWGSILLSEFSGIHIINNYVRACLKKKLLTSKFTKKEIRWLFPYELINLILLRDLNLNKFKKHKNTCYINSTYSHTLTSVLFQSLSIITKLRR